MKRGSTVILRSVVLLMGLIVLLMCIFVLPRAINAEFKGDFDYGFIFVGMYAAAIPFFVGIYKTLKLLTYIDTSKIFTQKSVQALRSIKYCALVVGGLYAIGLPYIFYVADRDDAPGVFAVGLIIVGVSLVVASAAAMFQGLLQNAVQLKNENDLTV